MTTKGLVVILGCSHVGVINTIKRMQKLTATEAVHAVIGGMHLEKASMSRIHLTIQAFIELGVEKVIPLHCTGFTACSEMARLLQDRFAPGSVGVTFQSKGLMLVYTSSYTGYTGGSETGMGYGMFYNEKVLEHFINPRNVGEIPDADGVGTIGDPACGDYLRIYVKAKDGKLVDVKFKLYGCPAAIGTSSVTTELATGKTLEEAYQIAEEDVIRALGGLPDQKIHCSVLGPAALRLAILDYISKSRPQTPEDQQTEN